MENNMSQLSGAPVSGGKGGMIAMSVGLLVVGLVAGYFIGKSGADPVAYQTATPTMSTAPTISASPSTSATADWKTYSYPQFGYSFKIPATLFLSIEGISSTDEKYFISQRIVTSYDKNAGQYLGPGFLVISASSLEDGIQKIITGATPITNRQQVMIGTRSWTSFNLGINNGNTDYVIYTNHRLYVVGGGNETNDFLKQIASTYTFTN